MIKDYLSENDYEDIQITNSDVAGSFFKNYLEFMKDSGKEPNIFMYYEKLADDKKKVVWHMTSCLLSQEKREQNLKGYFSELLEYREMKRETLVKMIDAKLSCEYIRNIEPVYADIDIVRSKIQNFAKVMHSKEDSFLLKDICALLNVDYDAISTGFGEEYEIDKVRLITEIEKQGYEAETFLKEFVAKYVPCEGCEEKKNCSYQKEYFQYLQYDVVNLSKALCNKLNIPIENILISKTILIVAENDSFEEYYKKLSKNSKRIIYCLIRDLYSLK